MGALIGLGLPLPARANVITDWDEKAVAVVTPLMANFGATSPYMAQRRMGMVHAAMFDAVAIFAANAEVTLCERKQVRPGF